MTSDNYPELEARLTRAGKAVNEMTMLVSTDIDNTPPVPRRPGRILSAAAAIVVLLGVGIGLLWANDDDPDTSEEVRTDEEEQDDPQDLEADAEPNPALAAVVPAGPRDGASSYRYPISISPSANLFDGDVLEVSSIGFRPNAQVGMVQCWIRGSEGSIDNCDISQPHLFTTDANGAFTTEFTVSRRISVGGEQVDCAQQDLEQRCFLGVGELADYDRSAAATLHFVGDDGIEEPASVSVEPATTLVHDQEVVVTGQGFPPGLEVHLAQCVIGGFDSQDLCMSINPQSITTADEGGFISTTVLARRLVQSVNGVADCAQVTCNILARAIPPSVPVPLTFDPAGPMPDGQTVTAAGNAVLQDGQTIRIDGDQMLVDGDLRILQCTTSGYCEDIGEASVVGGSTTSTVPISRAMWQPDRGQLDCLDVGCQVVGWLSGVQVFAIDLEFDPSAPAPVGPKMVLTPNGALTDGQEVRISFENLDVPSDTPIWSTQCTADRQSCLDNMPVMTDSIVDESDLAASRSITAQRRMPNRGADGGLIDCAVVECVVFASVGDVQLGATLVFDPDAPLAPLPTLDLSQSTELVNGQQIDVTLSSGEDLYSGVRQCVGVDQLCVYLEPADWGTPLQVVVYRTLIFDGTTYDCAASACTLEASTPIGLPISTDLSFDPNGPLPAAPEIIVPAGPFQAGQEIEIELIGLEGARQVQLCGAALNQPDEYYGSCNWMDISNQPGSTRTVVLNPWVSDYDDEAGAFLTMCTPCELVVTSPRATVKVPIVFVDTNASSPSIAVALSGTLGEGAVEMVVTIENMDWIDPAGIVVEMCARDGACVSGSPGSPIALDANISSQCAQSECYVYASGENQGIWLETVLGETP